MPCFRQQHCKADQNIPVPSTAWPLAWYLEEPLRLVPPWPLQRDSDSLRGAPARWGAVLLEGTPCSSIGNSYSRKSGILTGCQTLQQSHTTEPWNADTPLSYFPNVSLSGLLLLIKSDLITTV